MTIPNAFAVANISLYLAGAAISSEVALAADEAQRANRIETEHMFGFLICADTGEIGEKEIEIGYEGRSAKRRGRYHAHGQKVELEYEPLDGLRTSFGGNFATPGLSNPDNDGSVQHSEFQSLFFDLRQRFLDRERSGIGLALAAEPRCARLGDATGPPAREYGLDLTLPAHAELVRRQSIAAISVTFDLETARQRTTSTWKRESALSIASALMTRLHGDVFLGGEVRYLRAYDGSSLNHFKGHSLFAGPALFVRLTEKTWLSASSRTQVGGSAVEETSRLKLVNFEHNEARLNMGVVFG